VLGTFARKGIDLDGLAIQLQREGAAAFVKSWDGLLAGLAEKSVKLGKAG
jgi:transaldolase